MSGEYQIIFEKAAETWQQGCLLGNGFMGEVIYGQPEKEIIELSHITFFSGSDRVNPYKKGAFQAFQKMREAAAAGDYETVSEKTEEYMGIRGNYGTNLPVGRLLLDFGTCETFGEWGEYERFWDLEQGLAGCRFRQDGFGQERCAFASHPHRLFVYRITTQNPSGIDFSLRFDGGRNPQKAEYRADGISFEVQAKETLHSDGREGVTLVGNVRVLTDGAQTTCTREGLQIRKAGEAIICLMMDTDYGITPGGCEQEMMKARREAWKRETLQQQRICLQNFSLSDYEEWKRAHTEDVSALMNRQTLHLCCREEEKTVEELLARVREGKESMRLTELMYQLGRYLLLSSSREDSPLPAPLQGVWNDDVACRIGWTCDMHLDINTQMNYWISEPGNLGECHAPVFEWMEKRLIALGRKTAAQCYGRSGWVGELVSNAWGYAAPYWSRSLSPCPTGGIWQASDYMEHYRYTQNREFLRERALPVLREAVEFFLAYVWEENGVFHCGPSISPENAFLVEGKKYFASNDCTYELLMIRELLMEFRECCEELGTDEMLTWEETDCALYEQAGKVLAGLPSYRVLADGTLAEWAHDYPSADGQHRHTSHLLGLFPYHQITVEDTPWLAAAAARSIAAKLTPYEKWEDTGWARSMLTLYSARLADEKQAYRHLSQMQRILTGPNLLVMHPPTRGAASFKEVYELDGNTGFSMSVMEMLVQSHDGKIRLLPALPGQWSEGSFTGVVIRGGIVMDFTWKNHRPSEICLQALRDTAVVLLFGEERRECTLFQGKRRVILWD